MSAHTALPWNVISGRDCPIIRSDVSPRYNVATTYHKADAAFIVRAVNSHDAMLAALHQARLQIDYLHRKFEETGSGNAVLAEIDVALAIVEASA